MPDQSIPEPIEYIVRENDPPFVMPLTKGKKKSIRSLVIAWSLFLLVLGCFGYWLYAYYSTKPLYKFLAALLIGMSVAFARQDDQKKYGLEVRLDTATYGNFIKVSFSSDGVTLNFAKRDKFLPWKDIDLRGALKDIVIFTASDGTKAYIPRRAFSHDEHWHNTISFLENKIWQEPA